MGGCNTILSEPEVVMLLLYWLVTSFLKIAVLVSFPCSSGWQHVWRGLRRSLGDALHKFAFTVYKITVKYFKWNWKHVCTWQSNTWMEDYAIWRCQPLLCAVQFNVYSLNFRFLMLVSTMDGYVTALDGQTGNVQWTLATGSGPLISSSISNLEVSWNVQFFLFSCLISHYFI